MIDRHDIATTVAERTSLAGVQTGAFTSIAGWLTLNDWLAIGGFMLALVSVAFQVWATWHFKSRHLKIAEARLAADLENRVEENG